MLIPEDDPVLDFLPYCHKRPRGNSITPQVQRAFIYQLAMSGIVKQAATKVGKSIEALYKIREKPGAEDFRRAWDEALEWGGCGSRIARWSGRSSRARTIRARTGCSAGCSSTAGSG